MQTEVSNNLFPLSALIISLTFFIGREKSAVAAVNHCASDRISKHTTKV